MSQHVQLFHTCLVNEIDPRVGMAAVRVLERAGVEVQVPLEQTCCGQPAYNAGFHDQARDVARHIVGVLERTHGPIVVPSGSCADMLVHQYPRLFRDDPVWLARARAVATRCREFAEFLAGVAPGGVGGRLETCVAYHPSCHLLRGLGVRDQPRALIEAVHGVRLVDVSDGDECCGFGGVFSVTQPAISTAMLDRKLGSLLAAGADRIVSCDLGCLLHLAGALHRRGSRMRVQHLAQFLDEASA